jgi:hypothetical protein
MEFQQFTVFTPQDEKTYDATKARFDVSDSGVLEVWPPNHPDKITYGPAGWSRVEEEALDWTPPSAEEQ